MYKDYGDIIFDIKTVMDKKGITVSQVVKKTGLHHKVVRRYYDGTVVRYDKDVLSKLTKENLTIPFDKIKIVCYYLITLNEH